MLLGNILQIDLTTHFYNSASIGLWVIPINIFTCPWSDSPPTSSKDIPNLHDSPQKSLPTVDHLGAYTMEKLKSSSILSINFLFLVSSFKVYPTHTLIHSHTLDSFPKGSEGKVNLQLPQSQCLHLTHPFLTLLTLYQSSSGSHDSV